MSSEESDIFSLKVFAEIFLMALHEIWRDTVSYSFHNPHHSPLAWLEHLTQVSPPGTHRDCLASHPSHVLVYHSNAYSLFGVYCNRGVVSTSIFKRIVMKEMFQPQAGHLCLVLNLSPKVDICTLFLHLHQRHLLHPYGGGIQNRMQIKDLLHLFR